MRKLLHIFLSIFIVYATTVSAYATTSVGGWTATDTIIAGANTTINAIKNGANGALKSAVTVAPNASKVGKFLIKGGGTAALLIAVPQIVGDAVDWVLDPDNNAVKVTPRPSSGQGFWAYSNTNGTQNPNSIYRVDRFAACQAILSNAGLPYYDVVGIEGGAKCLHSGGYEFGMYYVWIEPKVQNSPPYYVPIDQVAAKVISNAASGEPSSQDAVKATALEGFAAGEHDSALDAAAEPDTGVENPAEPTDPAVPVDPAVPFDPSSILSAIAALKAMLAGILSAVIGLSDSLTGFFDWVKAQWSEFVLTFGALNDWLFDETPPTDTDNTITPSVPPVVPVQVAIDFVGGCPAPLGFDFNFYGRSYQPAIPFTPICDVAILINPIIKICATIAAAYIVAGIRQGSN